MSVLELGKCSDFYLSFRHLGLIYNQKQNKWEGLIAFADQVRQVCFINLNNS